MLKVLVAGSSGFVGARLCPGLVSAGHTVRAMTRKPDRYGGAGEAVYGDVAEPDSLRDALSGCEVAYYLVHSLGQEDFERQDADAARAFGEAAAAGGVQRIIYLGGLGDENDDLSAHLRSRREVEQLLAEGGVPVTVLRAGIIIGDGGISWEITRQLVQRLPAMITPRWVDTRTQPIAVDDVVRYLIGCLTAPDTTGEALDVGGPDVLTYADMMRIVADVEGLRRIIVPVPILSPSLSARWLRLITDVDTATGRDLIDSMSNEVVVRDDRIRRLIPFEPVTYREAVRRALADRAKRTGARTP